MTAPGPRNPALSIDAPAAPSIEPLRRRRRLSTRSGRALEILAHAIEYLTDEFIHEKGQLTVLNGRLQAIELLMTLNRSIYYESPEAATITDRCKALVRRCLA